jgi:RNA-directed DNA polymerase
MDIKKAIDLSDLGAVLNCTAKQLGYYIYKKPLGTQYKEFKISKRSGGTRTISAPSTNLKLIQRNIARHLETLRYFKPCVNGFLKDRDIRRNAIPHVSQKYVLNIDLEDFFGSVNYGRVYGLLSKPPYSLEKRVAAAIAKACTLNDRLPQGAPSSPIISNLICSKMDSELTRLAIQYRCLYTRYADDLTFSTRASRMPLASNELDAEGKVFCEVGEKLRKIIEDNGFKINEKKVRLRSTSTRQEVTGLIVNKKLNTKRRLIRQIRAMLHAWQKFGLAKAQTAFANDWHGSANFESALRGKIEFVGQIRGRPDAVFKKLADKFNKLSITQIRVALNPDEIAKQAVWVIENDDAGQGTAFYLEGYGLVTCAHCIGKNPIIYHPASPTKEIPVTVKSIDPHRDLAVLDLPSELKGLLPLKAYSGPSLLSRPDITLYGYPNHELARPIRIENGKHIRTFPQSAVSYLEITPKIIEGNSGGPVLDENYDVIGIAVRGLNGSTDLKHAEFFAVNISELRAWLPSGS